MFCRCLGFRFDIFPPEYNQHVFECLTVYGIYVPECLQGPFPEQGMKVVNFHLLSHGRLHFNHRVEQILKEFEFFTLSVKRHRRCLDRSNSHRLWFVL